jgi:hypothetical protein
MLHKAHSLKVFKMLNLQTATAAIAAQNNANTITAAQIAAALANSSVTFAQITTVTQVKTAAAHKNVSIYKVTVANVQLYNNVNAASAVYAKAVKRSAAQYANDAESVNNFTASAANYVHDANCYSIVTNNNTNSVMLYARYLRSNSIYIINGSIASKAQVAQYLTASAAQQLLNAKDVISNKTNNIVHNVRIATVKLQNVVQMRVRKQLLLK